MRQAEQTFMHDLVRKLRQAHKLDVLAIVIAVLVLGGFGLFLMHRSHVSHEIADAQTLTDRVVAAIAKQDTATVRKLGTKDFQAQFDKTDLSKQLKTFATIYGHTTPKIDEKIVNNDSTRQYVAVIYKYDRLKVAFFIRVDVVKPSGSSTWYLQALSTGHNGSPDQSQPASHAI